MLVFWRVYYLVIIGIIYKTLQGFLWTNQYFNSIVICGIFEPSKRPRWRGWIQRMIPKGQNPRERRRISQWCLHKHWWNSSWIWIPHFQGRSSIQISSSSDLPSKSTWGLGWFVQHLPQESVFAHVFSPKIGIEPENDGLVQMIETSSRGPVFSGFDVNLPGCMPFSLWFYRVVWKTIQKPPLSC